MQTRPRTRRIALSLSLAALLVLPAGAAACPDANVQPDPDTISIGRLNNSIVCLLNEQRAQYGLRPVAANGLLDAAALGHSTSMRWDSFFAHESATGAPFADRIVAAGYLSGVGSWEVGENIAWGSSSLGTPQALVTAWMNSPHHRDNVLNGAFREIGIGSDWGSPNDPNLLPSLIVTTDFGVVEPATKSKTRSKKKKRLKKSRPGRGRRRSEPARRACRARASAGCGIGVTRSSSR
jgi:uncharacterized protein YkwD